MLNRRDVLELAAAAGAAASAPPPCGAADGNSKTGRTADACTVDTNVSLFQWPFRRLPLDEIDALVGRFRSLGIGQAWAGSFEAILHRDLAGVNERLAVACRRFPELVPIGALNPLLSGWKSDLRRCRDFGMPGVRLLPGYHGYSLDSAVFRELLEHLADAGLFVQIAVALEDTRTQSDLVRVPDADLTPLVDVLPRVPGIRVQILNHRHRAAQVQRLSQLPGVYFDTARVDGTDGVPRLVQEAPAGRVLFGSHAPFLIPEAALIRLHESDQLDAATLKSVMAENARQLWRHQAT